MPVKAEFVPSAYGLYSSDALYREKVDYLMTEMVNENQTLKAELASLRIEVDSIRNEVKETKSLIDILLALLKQLQTLLIQLFAKLTK